ncbi:MAG TPA: methyltransferase, partial [Bacillota bacterium]|nr:methyltransferase [Bacillota bacterium]
MTVNLVELKPGERIDDLIRQDLKIIQDPASFCFSMDAVLLAQFVSLKKGDRVADLGTGTGVIPLLLTTRRQDVRITGLELQPDSAERAGRSVRLNRLEDKITIV